MGSIRRGSAVALAASVVLLGSGAVAAIAGASSGRIAPQTTITSAPPAEIVVRGGRTATATWEFTSNIPASFTCKFTGHQVAPCNSPMTYTGLTKGRYTFTVYAFIPHGERDMTRARSQVRVVKANR